MKPEMDFREITSEDKDQSGLFDSRNLPRAKNSPETIGPRYFGG